MNTFWKYVIVASLGGWAPGYPGQARSSQAKFTGEIDSEITAARSSAIFIRMNSVQPAEPAGSHGFGRYHIGLGYEPIPLESASASSFGADSHTIHKSSLSLITGLMYPLDVGFLVSENLSPSLVAFKSQQIAAHLQWTVFEEFGLPAISLRGSVAQLYVLSVQRVQSFCAGLHSSWGYGRVRLFGGAGVSQHVIKESSGYSKNSTTSDQHSRDEAFSGKDSKRYTSGFQWGVHVQLSPAQFSLALEQSHEHDVRQNRAKISYEF